LSKPRPARAVRLNRRAREVEAYLKAVQASVERLGRDGRTVLVAEAVRRGRRARHDREAAVAPMSRAAWGTLPVPRADAR
jgi:hypothetical protein